MSKFGKILVTTAIIFVFGILFGTVAHLRQSTGHATPGILGLILFGAVYGAVRAIWKTDKKDKNNEDNTNSSILQ